MIKILTKAQTKKLLCKRRLHLRSVRSGLANTSLGAVKAIPYMPITSA
ncbi:MAG: hypothetical protein ACJAXQ_001193 [Parvibaculaceae bacterium]